VNQLIHLADTCYDITPHCRYDTCNLQRWHNVHFTTAGKQFCAVEVAHTVAPLLNTKWLKLAPNGGEITVEEDVAAF
jgi:hypothetical protein